jgi:hypothetical protein
MSPPTPADFETPVRDLEGGDIFLSTITEDSREEAKGGKGECLYCGLWYRYRPSMVQMHLDKQLGKASSGRTRAVKACEPGAFYMDRHKQILDEVRRREGEKQQAERCRVESDHVRGRSGVDQRAGGSRPRPGGDDGSGTIVLDSDEEEGPRKQRKLVDAVTREQMNEQWAKAIVESALPISIVEKDEFRRAVLMSSQCGSQAISQQPGFVKDTTLPRRTTFTEKLIPELDEKLDKMNMERINGLLTKLSGIIISDGWKSTQHRPILNIILGVLGHSTLRAAIDTTGSDKTMRYIADLIIKYINEIGPGKIFAVCMDGACKGAFPLIREEFPWIQTFVCPSHGVDNFLKNVGSSNEFIRMQGNEVEGTAASEITWSVDFFQKSFDEMWECIKFVTLHEKPLGIFRRIALSMPKEDQPSCGTEPLKYGETRYASRVLMAQRLLRTNKIYEKLFVDDDYVAWLKKQKRAVKDKVSAIADARLFTQSGTGYVVFYYTSCFVPPSLPLPPSLFSRWTQHKRKFSRDQPGTGSCTIQSTLTAGRGQITTAGINLYLESDEIPSLGCCNRVPRVHGCTIG